MAFDFEIPHNWRLFQDYRTAVGRQNNQSIEHERANLSQIWKAGIFSVVRGQPCSRPGSPLEAAGSPIGHSRQLFDKRRRCQELTCFPADDKSGRRHKTDQPLDGQTLWSSGRPKICCLRSWAAPSRSHWLFFRKINDVALSRKSDIQVLHLARASVSAQT
jgi:hypothetical protein